MTQQHVLERRAQRLAGALRARVTTVSGALAAPQGRIPFHTKLPMSEGLAWWAKNRQTPLGQAVYDRLQPLAKANLDYNLTLHAQSQDALGVPVEAEPLPPPQPGMGG